MNDVIFPLARVDIQPAKEISCFSKTQNYILSLPQRVTKVYKEKIQDFITFLWSHEWYTTSMFMATLLLEPLEAAKSAFLWPCHWKKEFDFYGLNPKTLSPEALTKDPVLLIHGNYHNPTAWLDLAKKLQKEHVGPIYTVSLPSGNVTQRDFDLLTTKLQSIADQYAEQNKIRNVSFDIVGHSRGGYLARELDMTWGDRSCIGKVITIGFVINQEAMDRIQKVIPMFNQRSYEITGEEDALVRDKSLLSDDHKQVVKTGHIGLLYSNEVHTQVIKWLKT